MLLPEAFRSLSRPSSAPDAKAFPLRSFTLDLVWSLVLIIFKNHAGISKKFILRWLIVLPLLKSPQLNFEFFIPLCCLTFVFHHLCSVFKVHSTKKCGSKLPNIQRLGSAFLGKIGGPKWTRTADPLRAKQVLSQLSYTPMLEPG